MEAPAEEQDGCIRSKQEAETLGNAVCKLCTTKECGRWVAGGCVRPPENGGPYGVQGPRLANGSCEPRGCKELEKRRRWVLRRGRRHSYCLELTIFMKVSMSGAEDMAAPIMIARWSVR